MAMVTDRRAGREGESEGREGDGRRPALALARCSRPVHVWGSRPSPLACVCVFILPPIPQTPVSLYPVHMYYVSTYRVRVHATHSCAGKKKIFATLRAQAETGRPAVRRRRRSAGRQEWQTEGQQSSQDEEMVPLLLLSEQEEPVQLTVQCTHTANQCGGLRSFLPPSCGCDLSSFWPGASWSGPRSSSIRSAEYLPVRPRVCASVWANTQLNE